MKKFIQAIAVGSFAGSVAGFLVGAVGGYFGGVLQNKLIGGFTGALRGRFLGFSAEVPTHINVGEWQWSRLTTTRKNEALKEAMTKFVEHQRVVESRP